MGDHVHTYSLWFFILFNFISLWAGFEYFSLHTTRVCDGPWVGESVHHYLYSLDARTDNLFVVVFGAEWTRILALPQKVESATVTRSLWAVPIKERWRRCEMSHKSELHSSSNKVSARPRLTYICRYVVTRWVKYCFDYSFKIKSRGRPPWKDTSAAWWDP